MNDPIEKSVTVPLSADAAFALFTTKIDTWWPKKTHSVLSKTGRKPKLTFPAYKGGEIVERDEDGRSVVWGRIIAYDPGQYVAFTWFPGKTEAEATIVQVTFTPDGAGTRCDLTHGGWDVLGDLADAVSDSYLTGWDMVLGCYCSAATTPQYA